MSKYERLVLYLIAHFGVRALVADKPKKRGKTPEDASLLGHVAGSAAGWLVLNVF